MIKTAALDDIQALYSLTSDENHVKDNQYFERSLKEQAAGLREVFVAFNEGVPAGYCHYQRKPRYQPFRSLQIPEIQDLYVNPGHRQRGCAQKLIEHCIEKAREEGKDMIGLGVGLYSNYGKAQKLYAKMGFEPDGAGAVYERLPVAPGQFYKIDDEFCLMMIRKIG